jgi:hypothetical protein
VRSKCHPEREIPGLHFLWNNLPYTFPLESEISFPKKIPAVGVEGNSSIFLGEFSWEKRAREREFSLKDRKVLENIPFLCCNSPLFHGL